VDVNRYDIARERQDEFGVMSQQRAAAARSAGRFDAEIFPLTVRMQKADKEAGKSWVEEVTVKYDEGIRPDTTLEGVSKIKPAIEGGTIAAGNASQFSDGPSASVVQERKLAG